MKLKFPLGPPRLQFTLRTLFVAITLLAIWLGYHVNWIRRRDEARQWLDDHPSRGLPIIVCFADKPGLSWPLKMLGEEPMGYRCISPHGPEIDDGLASYRTRVAEIQSLFPEGSLVDTSEYE